MYAVIFAAKIKHLDEDYLASAQRLRKLAQERYGCVEFNAVAEGEHEIAISYWETLAQIEKWKQDAEHLQAQKLGKEKWYESYHVKVVQVLRTYSG